jgi:Ribonuclease HI
MRKKMVIYADGGSRGNPGPSAVGVVILDDGGKKLKKSQSISEKRRII